MRRPPEAKPFARARPLLALLLALLLVACGEKRYYGVSLDGQTRRVDAEGRDIHPHDIYTHSEEQHASKEAATALASAGPTGALTGVIDLDPSLGVDPERYACVFLMARRDPRSLMADVIKKIDAPDFPLHFELTALDAAHLGGTLAGSFQIVARLDSDGDAPASLGDVQGIAAQPATAGGAPVAILLNQMLTGSGEAPAPGTSVTAPPSGGPLSGGPFAGAPVAPKFPPGQGPRIRGRVTLGEEYSALDGRYTLWVGLRSVAGGGMPMAVQRFDRAAFPVEFDLGAEHAPLQADDTHDILRGELKLFARLSLSGGASAQPGDLEAESVLVKGDAPPVALVLDRQRAP